MERMQKLNSFTYQKFGYYCGIITVHGIPMFVAFVVNFCNEPGICWRPRTLTPTKKKDSIKNDKNMVGFQTSTFVYLKLFLILQLSC